MQLANDGINTAGTPTGEVCQYRVKKYKGWDTQYSAMYAYTVHGQRHEVRGAATFDNLLDVPTAAEGVEVRYLPGKPTAAVAHDEAYQYRIMPAPTSMPKVTTDCSK
ncbi:hypothetical protein ACWGJ9_09710 [Curtobacterium citreum]